MKYQILFSGKNIKNEINLSSVEFTHRVAKSRVLICPEDTLSPGMVRLSRCIFLIPVFIIGMNFIFVDFIDM